MKRDLKKLLITSTDFKELRKAQQYLVYCITSFFVLCILGEFIQEDLDFILVLLMSFSLCFIITMVIDKLKEVGKKRNEYISPEFKKEIEKFNAVIKSIDVLDQLKEVGSTNIDLSNRYRIIKAMKLFRKDLIRAIKTEKILSENRDLIQQNLDFFENSLVSFEKLKVDEKSKTYNELLNDTLQIAVKVQEEMRKIQDL